MTRKPHALSETRRTASLTDHPESAAAVVRLALLAVTPLAVAVALTYSTLAVVALSALAGAAAHRGYVRRAEPRERLRPRAVRP